MPKQWLAMCKAWADALDGLDDPPGEHVARLEERLRRLEEDVKDLRARLPPLDAP